MGKRGPKRQPTKILKLHGSRWAKGRSDIEVETEIPACPDGLGEIGRQHWADIVPRIAKKAILSDIDWPKLKIMCRIWERLETLEPAAKLPVKRSKTGGTQTNEAFYAVEKLWLLYDRYSSQFGMGASNRAGMGSVQKKSAGESKTRFFQKGGA